jgi:hypothetical protein
MLVIRDSSDDHLVVGTSRTVEFLGLLFCGIGLFFIGIAFYGLIERLDWANPIFLMIFGQYPAIFGIAGLAMVFMQQRFIFYRPDQRVFFKQGISKEKVSKFSEYTQVELIDKNLKNCVLSLFAVDGRRLIITRGRYDEIRKLGQRIAECLQLPLEVKHGPSRPVLKPKSDPPASPPPAE